MLNTLKYPEYNWNIFIGSFKLAWSILTNGMCQFFFCGTLLVYAVVILFKFIWKYFYSEDIRVSEINAENGNL